MIPKIITAIDVCKRDKGRGDKEGDKKEENKGDKECVINCVY